MSVSAVYDVLLTLKLIAIPNVLDIQSANRRH
jgi:hypothetical protein